MTKNIKRFLTIFQMQKYNENYINTRRSAIF